MWLRLVLAAAGAVAALLVARTDPIFGVVQGMAGLAIVAILVFAVAVLRR